MENKNNKKNQAGFSLIEIMIVMGIMGLLVAVVGPNLISKFQKAKVDTTRVQMKTLSGLLKSYRLDCNLYPTTDQGLEALATKPTSGTECKNYAPGGYIGGKIPHDGWDKDFLYTSDGATFEIKSLGGDMKPGGTENDADIIVTDQD